MKYTLYGKKYRYRGFKLDVAIIAVCLMIGITAIMALIFRGYVYVIMWLNLWFGVVLGGLLAVKHAVYHHIVRAVLFGITAAGLAAAVVLDGIYLFG